MTPTALSLVLNTLQDCWSLKDPENPKSIKDPKQGALATDRAVAARALKGALHYLLTPALLLLGCLH